MRRIFPASEILLALGCAASALALAGCASTETSSGGAASAGPYVSQAKADDGRTVNIGKASPGNGGVNYKDPHMEKCWIAEGFNFNGYDTLYIAPTLSTAKLNQENKDEAKVHDIAREKLVAELARMITAKRIFTNVVTQEGEIKPGVKALKLENTITEFAKGGGAARYFVGLYGGGQPVLRVQGKMTDGDKPVFTFDARRSGTSAGARMTGVFMKDEDIQIEDIRSMVLDLTDFMAVIAGKYQAIK